MGILKHNAARRWCGAARPPTPERNEPALERNGAKRNEVEGSAAASDALAAAGAADGRLRHGEVKRRRRPARCGEERAAEEGHADAERPANHPRASDGAMPAGAHLSDRR